MPKALLDMLLSHFSCVQLCDPINGSAPGSPIPGILQARTLEWFAISYVPSFKFHILNLSCVPRINVTWS